eukprot:TRINITY_DN3117_c0_g1_i3.p1 TRINITY_DN3117_c0_g1~~TRINITY_DN3117_c0_g1_i3.p1  ORF type:complete len:258 (-),score=-20.36 TRINITY_DN3117_c0_g1_i3:970-1743(-)
MPYTSILITNQVFFLTNKQVKQRKREQKKTMQHNKKETEENIYHSSIILINNPDPLKNKIVKISKSSSHFLLKKLKHYYKLLLHYQQNIKNITFLSSKTTAYCFLLTAQQQKLFSRKIIKDSKVTYQIYWRSQKSSPKKYKSKTYFQNNQTNRNFTKNKKLYQFLIIMSIFKNIRKYKKFIQSIQYNICNHSSNIILHNQRYITQYSNMINTIISLQIQIYIKSPTTLSTKNMQHIKKSLQQMIQKNLHYFCLFHKH